MLPALKDQKIILLLAAVLALLLVGGGLFFWQRQSSETEKVAAPKKEAPQPLVTPPPAEEMPYESFATADGNLSFEIPSAWTRAEIKNLETVLPKNFIDKYNLAMPLILSDPRGAQISLSVYRFEKGTSLDAAMDSFRADLVEMGQPYNEVSRRMEGEMLVVESTVDAGQGVVVKFRDLLFLVPGLPAGEAGEVKDTVYNISFSAREPNWGDYEAIFDRIQSSAKSSP